MPKLSKDKLKTIFPKASEDFIEANALKVPVASGENDQLAKKKPHKLKLGRQPNQTEAEMGRMLEVQRRQGEILRYIFEGIRLKWGDGMWYKPDWFVLTYSLNWRCIEVKGAKIWDRDIVRFKGARAAWPEFDFQMWQKKEGLWNQLS